MTESSREAGAALRRSPFIEALAILLAWRRIIFGFTAGVVLATVVYSLVVKPTYTARSSILPKQDEGQLSGLSGLVNSQFGSFAGGLVGATTSTDILMTILESRFLRDRVIDRLELTRELGIKVKDPGKARETTHARLLKMTEIGLTKRLSLFVEARAGKPELAASIANAYFEELDRLNQEFSFTSARQTRVFIEERLGETRDSLAAMQSRLSDFQSEHGMVALDEQAKAAVDVASTLQAELISLEAQIEVARKYSTGSFSRTRDLQYRADAVRNRLLRLAGKGGAALAPEASDDPLLIPFNRMPDLSRRLADLLLDIKTQQAVFTLLTTQHQQAKIDEARDVPTIQVLDRAEPPVFKSAPKRKKNVLVALVLGLFVGAILAFASEYLLRTLSGPSGASLRALAGPFIGRVERWLADTRISTDR